MSDAPVFVGELNPYGARPEFALYPSPPNCAGDRLRRMILGIAEEDYLALPRYNLCAGAWNLRRARVRALQLIEVRAGGVFVLLGRRVQSAFGFDGCMQFQRALAWDCYGRQDRSYVLLPHPSGRCRAWNAAGSFKQVRDLLLVACPGWAREVGL